MAYRPDDPYNIGINTIGTDLSLGNINQGQVPIQVAGKMSKQEHDQLLKDAGVTVEGGSQVETFPRFLADEYGSYKPYLGGPGATETIVEDYKGTYPGLLDVPTKDLQKRFDIGLENPNLMEVKKLGDEEPYDFSRIKGQTAGLNIPFLIRQYLEKRATYGLASTGANILLEAKAKAAAAAQAQAQASQRQADQARISRAYREETGGQAGSYAPGGGSGAHAADASGSTYSDPFDPGGGEARGGFIDGTNRRRNYLDGGLIDFFRYGGFIG